MGFVGTSGRTKTKNVHLLKISLFVQIGGDLCSTQIPLTQYRPESLMLRSKAISNGSYGAITATRAHSSSSPICTSRLIFGKGGFFHLVLSEYGNQSHNFKNVNFSSLYGKQDVNTKIWGQLRALGCTIKEATYYH